MAGSACTNWVFGGPWSYEQPPTGEATGVDKELLDESFERLGAVIGGRRTYEAAQAWGGKNPWGVPSSSSPTGLNTSLAARGSGS